MRIANASVLIAVFLLGMPPAHSQTKQPPPRSQYSPLAAQQEKNPQPQRRTWYEVALSRINPNNVDYGSHTVSHADLPSLNTELLDFELRESKRFLEDILDEPITSLTYPAGRFDDRVVEHVQRAGYLTAWDKGGGAVRPGDDPFRLPRVRVHGNTSLKDFERKVWSGYWERKMERDS